jgi:hypothetical protein
VAESTAQQDRATGLPRQSRHMRAATEHGWVDLHVPHHEHIEAAAQPET